MTYLGEVSPVQNAYVVQSLETLPNGVGVLTLSLNEGYDSYKKLPAVLLYKGMLYGKTAWNSDRLIAYFRTDAEIARAKK